MAAEVDVRSETTAEIAAEISVLRGPASRPIPWALSARVLLIAAVVLAALSLLVSRSPVYDVWTWQLWGRELAHGDLVTSFGPQFKPLPVFVAALCAPFGSAAVPIWMFLAHASGLLAVGAVARLACRAGGPVAAAISAAGLVGSYQFTFYLLPYGMSEPMLVALAFWAIDRHCDGRRRVALVLLFGASLLRPEVWPFLLGYAAVLFRGRQASRTLLGALLLLAPAAWFLPEWWGSGNPFRAGGGKALPNAPATKPYPGLNVLEHSFEGLLAWVWVGGLTGVAVAVWTRDRLLLAFSGIGACWLVIIAALTQTGTSSGAARYLIITQAMMCVLAGAGWVTLARWLRERLAGWPALSLVASPVLMVALAVPSLITLQGWVDTGAKDVGYQEGAYLATGRAVARAGGARVLTACGSFVWSAPYREPELAYLLHKHMFYARSRFEPDMPKGASVGPLVRISYRGSTKLLPTPFPLGGYRELGRATSDGVTAVVLSPC